MASEACFSSEGVFDVLSLLGALVLAGQTLVLMTPTKRDDAILARLEGMPIVGHALRALRAFAVINPRRKGK